MTESSSPLDLALPLEPGSRKERGAERGLLGELLKAVSRSFYLTLRVLPADVRPPVGLAYLFARAADTIADTDLLEAPRRLEFLNRFTRQFDGGDVDAAAVREIGRALGPHHSNPAERTLLARLDDCFGVYRSLSANDRARIRWLMTTLPEGMRIDLTVFPAERSGRVAAFETMADLDRYIYHVAGCVGEFWTEVMCDHRPSLRSWHREEMARIGVRYGKGLQLTNIVKDLARDLQRGRCYLPQELLEPHGLAPTDLLDPASIAKLRPVLGRLVTIARGHLDQGWMYTMAVPRREMRLRLACMWPILFAGGTLRRVLAAPDLLDPGRVVKIPKSEVYRVLGLTTGTLACGIVGTAYWGHLRKQLS